MSLIDPTYASNHMPLVSSVSEHSPSVWTNYFTDLNMILLFVPISFYYTLIHRMTMGKLFLAMYCAFTSYFSSCMIRLVIILAPAVCILAAITVSYLVNKATKSIRLALIGKTPE